MVNFDGSIYLVHFVAFQEGSFMLTCRCWVPYSTSSTRASSSKAAKSPQLFVYLTLLQLQLQLRVELLYSDPEW